MAALENQETRSLLAVLDILLRPKEVSETFAGFLVEQEY